MVTTCHAPGLEKTLLRRRGLQNGRGARLQARSRTGFMDYDEACFMHLTPGVVHNFPKAVGV